MHVCIHSTCMHVCICNGLCVCVCVFEIPSLKYCLNIMQ